MNPFDVLAGLSKGKQILAGVVRPLVLVAVGFGSAEAWEHRGPQGFPLVVFGDSLAVKRDAAAANARFWEVRARYWFDAYGKHNTARKACEATRKGETQKAADDVNTGFASGKASDDLAFNNGFASGDRAGFRRGRATCGAPDATSSVPPRDPRPAAGRVRDPGQAGPDPLFGGSSAYRPGD